MCPSAPDTHTPVEASLSSRAEGWVLVLLTRDSDDDDAEESRPRSAVVSVKGGSPCLRRTAV